MWHIFYYFDFFHLNKWVYSHWLVSRHDTGILCTYLTLVFLSWESNARQELETRFINIVLRSETCYSLSKLQYMPSLLSSYGHTVYVFVSIFLFCETRYCYVAEIHHHLGLSTSILKIQAGAMKSIFYSGFLNHYFTHLFFFP